MNSATSSAAAAISGWLIVWGIQASAQPPSAPVVVAPVVQQKVAATQSFVGTVQPSRTASIGSAVDGRVAEFEVNEGERVRRGQPLARLLTETMDLELAAAEAELEFRQQELAELENGTRSEEIDSFKAEMLSAEARMKYFRSRRERATDLFENAKAASQEERDEAISAEVAAFQAHQKATADYQLALAGPRPERIAQAQARVAIQEAIVDRLQNQIGKHTIISRFDGFITAEHTELGQWVKRGDLIVDVVALDEVEVVAYVVEEQIPHVKLRAQVRIDVPALAEHEFTGEVCRIVPQADVRARTFPVKVRVTNVLDDGVPLLKSGMLARVLLPTGRTDAVTLVPKDALVFGGPQPVVYIVEREKPADSDGVVRLVAVKLGVSVGSWIAVQGDLAAGQHVVTLGNERLRPGQAVVVSQVVEPGDDLSSSRPTPVTSG